MQPIPCPSCNKDIYICDRDKGLLKKRITHYCNGIYTVIEARTAIEAIKKWNNRIK